MADTTKKIDWIKIWSFIKSRIFTALIIIGLIIFSVMQCSRIKELKRKDAIKEQNLIALNDSITYHKTKNGELQAEKAGFISTVKDLKTLNKDLYDRIKVQDGQIISLNHSVVLLIQDTTLLRKYLVDKDKLIARLLKIDDNTYVAPWTLTYKYDSVNYDIFSGRTFIGVINKDPLELAHVNTELIRRETRIDLTWGQKVEKGVLHVFIQSNYPGFTVSQLEGVMIDPSTNPFIRDLLKPKKWFTGFGLGPSVTAGWNILDAKPALVIGLSLHYTIYQW